MERGRCLTLTHENSEHAQEREENLGPKQIWTTRNLDAAVHRKDSLIDRLLFGMS